MSESCRLITTEQYKDWKNSQTTITNLEKDVQVLSNFIVRHHPEMKGWIDKNFKRKEK